MRAGWTTLTASVSTESAWRSTVHKVVRAVDPGPVDTVAVVARGEVDAEDPDAGTSGGTAAMHVVEARASLK